MREKGKWERVAEERRAAAAHTHTHTRALVDGRVRNFSREADFVGIEPTSCKWGEAR